MKMNGIYVDDDPDASRYVPRLESDRLKIHLREPDDLVTLADDVLNEHPAIVLLDYRLDEKKGSRANAATYRAAPVAQQIRDRLGATPEFDFPIVLISSEDKIRTLYRPEKTAHDLFDWKLYKSTLGQSNEPAKILVGLSDGYITLRRNVGKFNVNDIFGLREDIAYLVDFQELREAIEDAEYPHIAARYILNFVIRRQGILIDRANIYARLGIEAPDPQSLNALNNWIAAISYRGVFHGCSERWWPSLFEELFSDAFEAPIGRFTAAQRAEKLSALLGVHFEAARDRWTQSADFKPAFACASCRAATPLKHSLACLDVRLPSFVQRQRVCYSCIQTDQLQESRNLSDDNQVLRLDDSEQRVADRIRSGQLTPEAT